MSIPIHDLGHTDAERQATLDAPRPTDADIEQWLQDAELWRGKRDYQRQLDAAGLDGYAFMQRYCEAQHNDNMRPENIIPLLRELLELRRAKDSER